MEKALLPLEDSDMDSMFILPLSILPLKTPALKTARLLKNGRLESVVEIFRDNLTGSGQVKVEALPTMYGWPTDTVHPDLAILRQVSRLQSYDIYSLRITLREQGIPVNNYDELRLSAEKEAELTRYMVMFTHPLTQLIYGDQVGNISSYADLLKLFRDPDVDRARRRLHEMADSLKISVMDVPLFLENFGDTFMSLSYFRYCLERLEPYFSACLDSIRDIRSHFQLKQNASLMKSCDYVEDVVNSVTASITGRLEVFERRTQQMWGNINQEEFNAVRQLIEREHVVIGAALCGLTVKMNAFASMFPHSRAGGPVRRSDFLVGEMIQGIDAIHQIEKDAGMNTTALQG